MTAGAIGGGYNDLDYATAYVDDGVLGLGRDHLGYWLKLREHNYDAGRPAQIRAAAHQRARFWQSLPLGTHQHLVVARDRDLETGIRRALDLATPDAAGRDAYHELLSVQAAAQSLNSPFGYQGFVGVYPEETVQTGSASVLGLSRLAEAVGSVVRSPFGEDPRPDARQVAQIREAGDRMRVRVEADMGSEGLADVAALRWLLARHAVRGIRDPAPGAAQPGYGGQIEQLVEGAVREDFDRVEISLRGRGGPPQAVAAVLVMTEFPDAPLSFPSGGSEWLFLPRHARVDGVYFPVDICSYVEVLNSDAIRRELHDIQLDIENGERDVRAIGAQLDPGMRRTLDAVSYLQEQLRRNPQNMCRYHGRLVVWASVDDADGNLSPERAHRAALNLLQDRCDALIDEYRSVGITVSRPTGVQKRLFAECLPGARLGIKQWGCLMPAMTLGQSMYSADQSIGDEVGPQIGWVDGVRPQPLRRDIFRPIRERSTTFTAITGATGSGKSFLLYLVSYLASVMGGMAMVFDQKREAGGLARLVEEAGVPTRVITFDGGSPPGQLDFCRLLESPAEQRAAIETAVQILMGRRWAGNVSAVVSWALDALFSDEWLRRRGRRSAADLLEIVDDWARKVEPRANGLPDFENPILIAQMELRKAQDVPVARAVFGRPQGDDAALRQGLVRGLTVLRFDGVQPPDPDVPLADQALEQRLAGVLVHALSIYARTLLEMTDDQRTPKVCAIDEGWMFTRRGGGEQGLRLLSSLIRLGSSKGVVTYVASQTPRDFADPELKDQIAEIFAFCVQGADAGRDTLRLLGLPEDSPQLARIVNPNMAEVRGSMYVRDVYGRTGPARTDGFTQTIRDAFNTRYARDTNLALEQAWGEAPR